jgi:hypothetical protein
MAVPSAVPTASNTNITNDISVTRDTALFAVLFSQLHRNEI